MGGKAITESDTFAKVQEFKEGSNKKPEKGKTKAQKARSTQKTNETERKQGKQNESRCSLRVNKQDHRKYMYQQLKLKMKYLHLMTVEDNEPCCICGIVEPAALKTQSYIEFV